MGGPNKKKKAKKNKSKNKNNKNNNDNNRRANNKTRCDMLYNNDNNNNNDDDDEAKINTKTSAVRVAENITEQYKTTLQNEFDRHPVENPNDNKMCVHVTFSGAYYLRTMNDINYIIVGELSVPRRRMDSLFVRNTNNKVTVYFNGRSSHDLYLAGPTMYGARDLTACVPKSLYRPRTLCSVSGRLGLMDKEHQLIEPSKIIYHLTNMDFKKSPPSDMRDVRVIRDLQKALIVDGTKYHGAPISGHFGDFLRRALISQSSYWSRFHCDVFWLVNYMTANASALYPDSMMYETVSTLDGGYHIRNTHEFNASGKKHYNQAKVDGSVENAVDVALQEQAKQFPIARVVRNIATYISVMLKTVTTLLPT
jgi:hypothetical protein